MDKSVQTIVDVVSYFCILVFVFEAVIKILAYGKAYFHEGWNIFDFVIVIGSLIFIAPMFKRERILVTFIRTLKLFKLAVSYQQLTKLRTFYSVLTKTMVSLFNVALLMFLVIYIFSIIGCQTFGAVKLNGPMTHLYNFQTVPKSMLTLYRVLTRDHWNELMEAVSIKNSILNECTTGPTYQDYVNNGY